MASGGPSYPFIM